MIMDQVKKAQEQFAENETVEEVMERFEALQTELNERFEAAQTELNERFEEATSRLVEANERVAETVTSRMGTMPGADRFPQPTEVVASYFDTIERITASNRDMAIKLVTPWMFAAEAATPKTKAAAAKTAAKPAAKKTTARKTTARKAPAKAAAK